jgi:hypothetical protein
VTTFNNLALHDISYFTHKSIFFACAGVTQDFDLDLISVYYYNLSIDAYGQELSRDRKASEYVANINTILL